MPTVSEIRDAVVSRRQSAVELTQAALARLDAVNPKLGIALDVPRDHALARAADVDARVRRGEPVGPLAGVPVAIKDNICTRDARTTCASRMLSEFRAPYDATVVERLLAADAVIIAKTNLDEFAMGSSTENSAVGPTRNPWALDRVPGGSSGGSAAAVAAGVVPLALGSDTGGSIRQPAAMCGVCGLKPTYGRVSRYGLVAFASSLDQVGPLARDPLDLALAMNVIAGRDPRDSTSVDHPVDDYVAASRAALDHVRIGVPAEFFGEGLAEDVRLAVLGAIDDLRAQGAELVEVSLPHAPYCVACYYVVCMAEASSNLARYDGVHYGRRAADARDYVEVYTRSREQGFGAEVKRRIMLGTYVLSSGYYDAYYLRALKVRTLIRRDYEAAFEACDLIVGPTTPTAAFRLGDKTADPLQMYLADIYTVSANLAGIPALSIPCGFTADGLPIGLQLQGPHFRESRLLAAARAYQQRTDWHRRRPAV